MPQMAESPMTLQISLCSFMTFLQWTASSGHPTSGAWFWHVVLQTSPFQSFQHLVSLQWGLICMYTQWKS